MKYDSGRVARWVGAYMALALTPLLFVFVGPLPAPRAYLVELGVGLGFLGISILALQFVTSGRFRRIAPAFGADVVLQFHRQAGVIAFALVLAHPAVMVLSDRDYLEFFDPRVNVLRALALTAVIPATTLLLVTSLWRERSGLNYEWWRALHGVLSLAIVFIGMVHGIQVGHYLGDIWRQGIWAGVLLGVMSLVVYSRVVRPWLMRRRPYEVVEVREELDDVRTLVVRAVGHQPMSFTAGQFAWITLGDTPYSLQQHPFSFSSSDRDDTISFTAKRLGDFTSSWDDIEPGQRAYLEGPFGGFTLDDDAAGALFVVGGIGITPAMSILRTMCDNGDRRPAVLVYGNSDIDAVPFDPQLAELATRIDLTVIHVPEQPPAGWTGPSGFVDTELLDECLTDEQRTYHAFICGPEPLMDAAEKGLRSLGVPWRRISSERFEIV